MHKKSNYSFDWGENAADSEVCDVASDLAFSAASSSVGLRAQTRRLNAISHSPANTTPPSPTHQR